MRIIYNWDEKNNYSIEDVRLQCVDLSGPRVTFIPNGTSDDH